MAAPRPGNDDRGWNDPPMFDYVAPVVLSNAASPRRTQLNKRVAFPMSGSSPNAGGALLNPEQGPPKLGDVQILPPANTLDPPTLLPVLVPILVPDPATIEPTTPPPVCPGAQSLQSLVNKLGVEAEHLQSYLLENLLKMVDEYKDKLRGRATEDVRRRLDVMNKMWSEEKLSDPVKLKIGNLVLALKENDLTVANQLHISLMVDHTAEVNQWMVAIKRLVLEKQNSLQDANSTTESSEDTSTPAVTFFTPPTSDTGSTDNPELPGDDQSRETTQSSAIAEG